MDKISDTDPNIEFDEVLDFEDDFFEINMASDQIDNDDNYYRSLEDY